MTRIGRLALASTTALTINLGAIGLSRAHEFWIDPVPQQQAGGPLKTDLRVGQGFAADIYPYLSSGFNAFRMAVRGKVYDIVGNEGDIPAVNVKALPEGLAVIIYYGKANRVTFQDAAVFTSYLALEGLDWVLDAHRKRGLPPTGFTEVFSRNVKSLVQAGPVGSGDKDVVTGMPFELVAGSNPYAEPEPASMPVTLLWQGKPAANAQLSIFQETDRRTRSTVRTDADGKAEIPLAGGGRFIVNAVHMREAPAQFDAAWESHWASLTFELPKR